MNDILSIISSHLWTAQQGVVGFFNGTKLINELVRHRMYCCVKDLILFNLLLHGRNLLIPIPSPRTDALLRVRLYADLQFIQ